MEMALTFNEIAFTPVTRQNSLWIRAVELAHALGYKRDDSVAKIYRANADEFTSDMAQVVEIIDNADSAFPVKSLLFSLRGCHLLAMFARTPVAKQFRRWVLDVIEQYGDQVPVTEPVESSDQSPSSLISVTPSSVADRKPLRSLVNAWARVSGQPFDACWSQVKAAFRLTDIRDLPQEWIPDAIVWVQEKIDAVPKALPTTDKYSLTVPTPAPERLPLYRNGAFHLPHTNKAHIPGPSEAALMALWKDWPRREKVISDAFNALMDDIRKYQGDSFPYLVSDMGRNADTMFGVDCLLEGLYCAQTSAISNFKRALELARLHLRLVTNVAVVQGR